MPNVRAKFTCTRKADVFNAYDKSKIATVTLQPASGEENREWSTWTHSGSIELQINNQAAVDAFVLGQSYFVDFTPAE